MSLFIVGVINPYSCMPCVQRRGFRVFFSNFEYIVRMYFTGYIMLVLLVTVALFIFHVACAIIKLYILISIIFKFKISQTLILYMLILLVLKERIRTRQYFQHQRTQQLSILNYWQRNKQI